MTVRSEEHTPGTADRTDEPVLQVRHLTTRFKTDRGIVTVETKGFNQDGEEVCYFRRKVLIWKKEFAPDRRRPYDGKEVWTDMRPET